MSNKESDIHLLNSVIGGLSEQDFQKFQELNTDAERYELCAELSSSDQAKQEYLEAAEAARKLAKETEVKIGGLVEDLESTIDYNRDKELLTALSSGPSRWQRIQWFVEKMVAKSEFIYKPVAKHMDSIWVVVTVVMGVLAFIYQMNLWIDSVTFFHVFMFGLLSILCTGILGGAFFASRFFAKKYPSQLSLLIVVVLFFASISSIPVTNYYYGHKYFFLPIDNMVGYRVKDGKIHQVLRQTDKRKIAESTTMLSDQIYWVYPRKEILDHNEEVATLRDHRFCGGAMDVELQSRITLPNEMLEPTTLDEVKKWEYGYAHKIAHQIEVDFVSWIQKQRKNPDTKTINFAAGLANLKQTYTKKYPKLSFQLYSKTDCQERIIGTASSETKSVEERKENVSN